ncbi:serine hydrolase [Polynucleobacter sp. UB-Siik-W21]|uniref:serine hydrolase n=1 Tax=Polynucleobacter sp. UB-Siik-W21 TaxID=1855646 RepID=UPI001BFEB52E|nr:serine hydrolase [Polynucleobacter sp. UB-Siik-W21]QWD70006.1 serine hydrolase [Polynucleobacter sp. UB-Siik-W21]
MEQILKPSAHLSIGEISKHMYKLLIACALALTFTDAPVFAKGRQAEDFHSNIAYVVDVDSGEVLVDRNSLAISPIASISKLMASIVVLESGQGLAEPLRIEREDIARQSSAKWKLKVGTEISRMRVLRVGLMSSENRAINALARSYVGGTGAFVAAMNLKAKELGMAHTHFIEPTGLSPQNVSTAQDLVLLLQESMRYPLIQEFSTTEKFNVVDGIHAPQPFVNTNPIVRNEIMDVLVQKTGYIAAAGRCLVMEAKIKGRNIAMVFLQSNGKNTRFKDALFAKAALEKIQ